MEHNENSRRLYGQQADDPQLDKPIQAKASTAKMRVRQSKIINLLREGHNPRFILKRVRVSPSTVTYYARQLGLRFKRGRDLGHSLRVNTVKEKARRLKALGWTYKKIAKRFKVRHQWIQQLLRIPKARLAEQCELCKSSNSLCGHHLDYLTDNFQTLCNSCHRQVHYTASRKTQGDQKERKYKNNVKNPINLLEQAALTTLKNTLEQQQWNKRQTAFALGISRVTLDAWISRHKIKVPKPR